ncbi:MAG TPA: class I SAM-dependent methyltransferase [Streptosporangiaceae bacterium]|jgi:methyltransferase (TIGR00027 family)|nr:class I SAM-dependent methyltransferase [Streptosporangiaceae bacterium]
MRDGQPSSSAQRVAAYRLGADRLAAPYGDPAAEDALALDVASDAPAQPSELMSRYLRARTSFFDRTVVNALDRGVTQIVLIGAGYDGRALRYAKPSVSWWEVDHPDTQADKRARLERLGIACGHVAFVPHDLEAGGLADSLAGSGFEADTPSFFYCEGVAVYLSRPALATLLAALRSLATPETRLAISLSLRPSSADAQDRRERLSAALAALGEPISAPLSGPDLADLFTRSRWRPVEFSERSQRAGLVLAAPA